MASLFAFGRAQLASVYRRRDLGRGLNLWPAATKAPPPLQGSLSNVIEYEIIPRLVALRSVPAGKDAPAPSADPPLSAGSLLGEADREAFFPLTVAAEIDVLLDFVDTLIARGIAAEDILLELLAPAARYLGELWESDRCDFVEVTMGLWRLQEVAHELGTRLPAQLNHQPCARALFAPLPGDQHSFGTVVLEEIFARGGWATERLGIVSKAELLDRVAGGWFDIVGLTVTCDCHMGALPAIIAAIRNVSCNPKLCVLVGGRIFVDAPERAIELGADATAPDARLALQVANSLVGAVARGTASAR